MSLHYYHNQISCKYTILVPFYFPTVNRSLQLFSDVTQGYNGTIFAYGQTGAGKSFSMFGPENRWTKDEKLRGIVPRACRWIPNFFHVVYTKLIEFHQQVVFLSILMTTQAMAESLLLNAALWRYTWRKSKIFLIQKTPSYRFVMIKLEVFM